jgi:chorismate mutase
MDGVISSLRIHIESLDAELLCLLRERVALVRRVGTRKGELGIPVFDLDREDALMARAPEELRPIYRAIIQHCRDVAERSAAAARMTL